MPECTVLSLEQALSLPSATLRFAQLGWRVIRVESTPHGSAYPGDPNRYIGSRFLDSDRRSYFIAASVGKEAIALNLKDPEGQTALHRIIRELDVDIFCCNTLPGRYEDLGIDYDTLRSIKPDIIWIGISAMGPEYPDTPGYDPAVQAMSGFMDLTGDPEGRPSLSGVPLIDLKAGDEAFAQACLALAERGETGKGKRIDISMLQAASSWLITTLPLLNFDPEPDEITRAGNQHRKFIPTDVFETKDSYIYIAVGNDLQWKRLVDIPIFAPASTEARFSNEGRHQERKQMYKDLHAITRQYTSDELSEALTKAKVPWSKVNTVPEVMNLDAIHGQLTTSNLPDGRTIYMQPPAVDAQGLKTSLAFSPKYGEHTGAILAEVGFERATIEDFMDRNVCSGPQSEDNG